jgi:hypothetical protein
VRRKCMGSLGQWRVGVGEEDGAMQRIMFARRYEVKRQYRKGEYERYDPSVS